MCVSSCETVAPASSLYTHKMLRSMCLFIICMILIDSSMTATRVKTSDDENKFRAKILITFINQPPPLGPLKSILRAGFNELVNGFVDGDRALGFLWSKEPGNSGIKPTEVWIVKGGHVDKAINIITQTSSAEEFERIIKARLPMPQFDSMETVTIRMGIVWNETETTHQDYIKKYDLDVVAIVRMLVGGEMEADIKSIYDQNPTANISTKETNRTEFVGDLMKNMVDKTRSLLGSCKWEMHPESLPCHFQPIGADCLKKRCRRIWYNRKVTANDPKYEKFCRLNHTWISCHPTDEDEMEECILTCQSAQRKARTLCNATCSEREGMEEIGVDDSYLCCHEFVPNQWHECSLTHQERAKCGDDPNKEETVTKIQKGILIGIVSFAGTLIILAIVGALAYFLLRKRRDARLKLELETAEPKARRGRKPKKKRSKSPESVTQQSSRRKLRKGGRSKSPESEVKSMKQEVSSVAKSPVKSISMAAKSCATKSIGQAMTAKSKSISPKEKEATKKSIMSKSVKSTKVCPTKSIGPSTKESGNQPKSKSMRKKVVMSKKL